MITAKVESEMVLIPAIFTPRICTIGSGLLSRRFDRGLLDPLDIRGFSAKVDQPEQDQVYGGGRLLILLGAANNTAVLIARPDIAALQARAVAGPVVQGKFGVRLICIGFERGKIINAPTQGV